MKKFRIVYDLNNERKFKDMFAPNMWEASNIFNRENRLSHIIEVIELFM